MRTAYTLLGLLFMLVFGAAYYLLRPAAAPSVAVPPASSTIGNMELTSSVFTNGGAIPSKYTCDGKNTNPPLSFSGMPESARSLALIMDDPDVPKAVLAAGVFDHWVVFNMAPATAGIGEGAAAPGIEGNNGAGKEGYTGPCPPPQYEPAEHRYFFRLFALDAELPLKAGASKAEVLAAMEGHILTTAELVGRYKRQ